jgi:predicted 2-oxoglutarate/Fe(II)-dependent dioxygenase YbiX
MIEIIFTEEECEKIINYTNYLKLRRQVPSPERFVSYQHYLLEPNLETSWIYQRLNSHLEKITNTKVIKEVENIMINHYSIGDGFEKHQDLYFKNQTFNLAVHLNDNYEGGDFVFDEPYYVMPKIVGGAYVFENTRWHEVKKVLSGDRWSMIAFYTRENIKSNNKFI